MQSNKKEREYSTVVSDEGVNYREIALTMTELGFPMNHSSARNYVLRIMKKFIDAYADYNDVNISDVRMNEIAKSPLFQNGIADLLHTIEVDRRDQKNKRHN